MIVSAQISLYPLRQEQLSSAIWEMQDALATAGLHVTPGPMSTLVAGDSEVVFHTLKMAFERAAIAGHVVLIATISNACPV
jgi:uncharacterized protein YqgV (UPF0045/DUF77 family)